MPQPPTRERLVLIRCDAGPSLGVGHVMRCVALAEEYAARGLEPVFVTDLAEVPWARHQVEARGFRHLPPPARFGDEVALAVELDPAWVVVDSYVLPSEVYAGYRGVGAGSLALVDGDPARRPADIWLDQNIGAEDDPWSVPAETIRLAGLDYALMRDDIRRLRPSAPAERSVTVPQVFAFFGGTDAFGAAPVVAAELAATGCAFDARFVAASADLARRCREVPLAAGQSLEVVAPRDDLAEAVVLADVVLSAAGTSSWELLCLGAAAGLVCVAGNQQTSYDRAVGAGLVAGLGYLDSLRASPGAAGEVLQDLLASGSVRASLRQGGWRRVDGLGRVRVADACAARFDRSSPG